MIAAMATEESEYRKKKLYTFAWASHILSYPLGIVVGMGLSGGQDPAGRGIGLGLGMMGGDALAIVSAMIISILTNKVISRGPLIRWLLILLPWLMTGLYFWFTGFTSAGDRFFTYLQEMK